MRVGRKGSFGLGILVALLFGLLLAAKPAHADTTFTVNSTGNTGDTNPDGTCDSNSTATVVCTLREAIQEANAAAGDDTIEFEIPDNPNIAGLEVKTIAPTAAFLPQITDTVTIDGYSQTGAVPNGATTNANSAVLKIQLSGANAPANAFGLAVSGAGAAGTTIKGLVINRFGDDGVFVNPDADNTAIEGNFIGTNAAGDTDLGNGSDGVTLLSSGNVVGGAANAAQNVISGNGENGVAVKQAGATGNTISNNHIGTDADASEDLGNSQSGVFVENAPGVIVGGNGAGGAGAGASGEGNIISGNDEHGVEIIGADSSDARVLGNFIGLNLNGSGFSEIGNTLDGVFVSTETQVEIGGALSGQGNTISDNGNNGVQLFGFTTTNNKVFGNHIGTNKNGSSDFGNARDGVLIRSSGNDIGGAATGARNVISGNNLHGVQISQSPTGNQVLGNFIGTNANGTSDLGNFFDGVHLEGNVSENEVASNTISGNGTGVEIFGARASGNDVSSNLIGTDASGTAGLGNSGFGVFINAPDNFIGSTVSGEGNTIAFNGQEGVVIAGGAATGNRILRNSIFSNGGLGIDLIGGNENPNGATANDNDDTDDGPNTLQNKPVLTSFSGLTIEGNLNSTPNRTFVIQFFGNLQGENEGRFFLGQDSVTTNSNGNVNFTFTAPAAPIETQNVTATATRAGNTSEFSAARPAELRESSTQGCLPVTLVGYFFTVNFVYRP